MLRIIVASTGYEKVCDLTFPSWEDCQVCPDYSECMEEKEEEEENV
jgi:hypothetical protein